MRKETVLFIFRSCRLLAGIEREALNLSRFIDQEKANVVVATHRGDFWNVFKEQTPLVRLIDFPFSGKHKWPKRFSYALRLFRKLKVTKAIWFQNHIDDFTFYEVLASWIVTRGNVFISHRNFPTPYRTRIWFGFIRGIGLWMINKRLRIYFQHLLAKKVLSVSKDVKDCLENYWGIPAKKITVCWKGIEVEKFAPKENASQEVRKNFNLKDKIKVFIAISRLSKEKRIDRLLGAFLFFLRDEPDSCLLILGDGPLKEIYEHRVNRNKILRERVRFLGFRSNVSSYLRGSDYLLHTSDKEGQCTVIKEAMACGIIPIVTDSPGTREISNNIFVSKRNVFDLYKKIKYVLSLPEKELLRIKEIITKEIRLKYDLKDCSFRQLNLCEIPTYIN